MGFANVRAGTQKRRAVFLGTRPNISESHSEISTRVPFCIAAHRPLGPPLADATYNGSAWHREFASGTKVVFTPHVNPVSGKDMGGVGEVAWGSKPLKTDDDGALVKITVDGSTLNPGSEVATAPVIQCGTRVLVPLLDSLMFGRVLK